MRKSKVNINLYGLIAEFDQPEPLIEATRCAQEKGYKKMDTFTPFPVEEVCQHLDFKCNWVSVITFVGGLTGAFTGYFMQWYANVVDYPINIGGRPFHSWPAFIPITFELMILGAAFSAALGMLVLNRLPEPYHPIFNNPHFIRASRDRFFLCIQADDPSFELERTFQFLSSLNPIQVSEVIDED